MVNPTPTNDPQQTLAKQRVGDPDPAKLEKNIPQPNPMGYDRTGLVPPFEPAPRQAAPDPDFMRDLQGWNVDVGMQRFTIYWQLHPVIAHIAKQHGYALTVHGSMLRDFDLVAIPWVPEASSAEELVEAIRERLGGEIIPDGTPGGRYDADSGKMVPAEVRNPEHKPHGRLAWNIHLGNGSFMLDLSVMPRIDSGEIIP